MIWSIRQMAADGAAAGPHAIVPMILSPLTKRGRSALLDAATEGGGDELQLQRILLQSHGLITGELVVRYPETTRASIKLILETLNFRIGPIQVCLKLAALSVTILQL